MAAIEPASAPSAAAFFSALRSRLSDVIRASFDEESAGVVLALVAGDRSEMPESLRMNCRVSGVSHLLALSGLHVGTLFLLLEWLFMRLRMGRKAAFLCSLPFMAGYAVLVGAPASVVRACLMFSASRLARLDGRPRDGLSVVALSLLPMLIVNPLFIEDAGFILSFSAVTGLALFGRPFPAGTREQNPLRRLCRPISQALRASLAAQVGVVPAMACLFNQLPLWFLNMFFL